VTVTAERLFALRSDVRDLLAETEFTPSCDSWMRRIDRAFTLALAERGFLGMAIPVYYGGRGLTYVERFVVTEELLRAGAPVGLHWIADRQVAPTVLAHGSERLRRAILPGICRGEISFCIGISEPNAGSDIAAIATFARPTTEGWVINGQKIWTTGGDVADHIYLLARTERSEDRHAGLSEYVIPMDSPGITVIPIEDLAGESHFCEVFFDDVVAEDWQLVGERGGAFTQVLGQLDFERSGPERLLSTYPLFASLLADLESVDAGGLAAVGRAAARFAAIRAMSFSIAQQMDRAGPDAALAAITKSLGNEFEQDVVELASDLIDGIPLEAQARQHLADAAMYGPAFTLRGGSTEIMREIVARRVLGRGGA
jgi:acyl-CoA dehydrogenase